MAHLRHNQNYMNKQMLNRIYGVNELLLTVDFSDRAIVGSRRSLGSVSLDEQTIKCVHPDCSDAEIRFTTKLYQTVVDLKKNADKTGSFAVFCQGSKKGSDGRLTCGGIYEFKVKVDY
jgi:hypothetical protein